jgi:hypothetical protein
MLSSIGPLPLHSPEKAPGLIARKPSLSNKASLFIDGNPQHSFALSRAERKSGMEHLQERMAPRPGAMTKAA